MKNRLVILILAITLGITSNLNAAIISHGNLTSDDKMEFIQDTTTGRQYLRFDTFDLNYGETLAAVEVGGAYEGWSIADSQISDDFINALFGVNDNVCTDSLHINGEFCGSLSGWNHGDFGNSYDDQNDYIAYLSDEFLLPDYPEAIIGTVIINSYGGVNDLPNTTAPHILDIQYINLLLYREAQIPEPSLIALLGLGLAGLAFSRRRHK